MPVDLANGLIARWNDPELAHIDLLRQAGIEAVVPAAPAPQFSAASNAAAIQTLAAGQVEFLRLQKLDGAQPGKPVALLEGSWPGIVREPGVPGRGDETASASREPWIEINGH